MNSPKIDFKRTLESYRPGRDHVIRLVDVPEMQYLMVDGHGDPNSSPAFADAISALYPIAYRLKFASKSELGRDYVVPPLEGLWWSDDMEAFTGARNKSKWNWTLMLLVPEWLDDADVARASSAPRKNASPLAAAVRLETLSEGRCAQTLHIGSFDDEAGILHEMHDQFIPDAGAVMRAKHHEIYLSDFRKVPPSRMRTILRQPIA